jgi:hypothetical protein
VTRKTRKSKVEARVSETKPPLAIVQHLPQHYREVFMRLSRDQQRQWLTSIYETHSQRLARIATIAAGLQ